MKARLVSQKVAFALFIFVLLQYFANTARADFLPLYSYSMPNGEVGARSYFDDTYSGRGDRNAAGTFLYDGLGKLADGMVVDGTNILDDAWVGWRSSQPEINFDLGSICYIESIAIHVANWSSLFDDVAAPGASVRGYSVTLKDKHYLANYVTTAADRSGDDPRWVNIPFGGIWARGLRITLADGTKIGGTNPGPKPWILMDEVRVIGVVPEPTATTLQCSIAPFAFSMFAQRRRR